MASRIHPREHSSFPSYAGTLAYYNPYSGDSSASASSSTRPEASHIYK